MRLLLILTALAAACSSTKPAPDEAPVEAEAPPVAAEAPPALGDGAEVIAESPRQWTGIAVVNDRIYVNFPRWSDEVPVSVGVLENGEVVPFPSEAWNSWKPGEGVTDKFVSVQSVVPANDGAVWVLDTGNPGFEGVVEGAARLFKFDGEGNKLEEFNFIESARPNTYLNDVRIAPEARRAYVTDSGAGGLIVLDMEMASTYRVLDGHPSTMSEGETLTIDGQPWLRNGEAPDIHADGIALHGDTLYYQALSGRKLYRVPTFLLERSEDDETRGESVELVAEVGPSDGLIAGPDGTIYLSSLEQNAVRALRPDGTIDVVLQHPLVAWPDSFSLGSDGALYVTTSRIHQAPDPPAPYGILRIELK